MFKYNSKMKSTKEMRKKYTYYNLEKKTKSEYVRMWSVIIINWLCMSHEIRDARKTPKKIERKKRRRELLEKY